MSKTLKLRQHDYASYVADKDHQLEVEREKAVRDARRHSVKARAYVHGDKSGMYFTPIIGRTDVRR